MKYLLLICAILVIPLIWHNVTMPKYPNPVIKLPIQAKCSAITDISEMNTDNLLIHYKLIGVQDAEDWVCVAILESGWQLDSELCQRHCNPIGMRSRTGYPHVSTDDGDYASYPSIGAHARDLIKWINVSPRKKGESFTAFLKRRGYNCSQIYYRDLKNIIDTYKNNE